MEAIKLYLIPDRPPVLAGNLLLIWEQSVRLTHDFLTEDDILTLRPFVLTALKEIPVLGVAETDQGEALGFIGLWIWKQKIEMLFLAPPAMGRGWGRKLMEWAMREYRVCLVDVNEENKNAYGFYQHMGFECFQRSKNDNLGYPFPILHLRKPFYSNAPKPPETP
jgi:putative acetyltransferase